MSSAPLCLQCLAIARFQALATCKEHASTTKPESRHEFVPDDQPAAPKRRRRIVHRMSLAGMTPEQRKERVKAQRRARYLAQTPEQKERARERHLRAYQRHRDERIARMRARYAAHIEQERSKNRAYYAQNREAINAKRRKR